jgi:NAD(P)-dependent dehydrogenase (short-subunit alcohol dehydrogenase family)
MVPVETQGGYASSKAAGSSMFQCLADEIPPSTVQIISLHPGANYTDAARASGYTENSLPWDDGE